VMDVRLVRPSARIEASSKLCSNSKLTLAHSSSVTRGFKVIPVLSRVCDARFSSFSWASKSWVRVVWNQKLMEREPSISSREILFLYLPSVKCHFAFVWSIWRFLLLMYSSMAN